MIKRLLLSFSSFRISVTWTNRSLTPLLYEAFTTLPSITRSCCIVIGWLESWGTKGAGSFEISWFFGLLTPDRFALAALMPLDRSWASRIAASFLRFSSSADPRSFRNPSRTSLGFLNLRRTTKSGAYPSCSHNGASTSFVSAQSILLKSPYTTFRVGSASNFFFPTSTLILFLGKRTPMYLFPSIKPDIIRWRIRYSG